MERNEIEEYWINGGGSDGELRCALEGFCGMGPIGVGIEDAYLEGCGEQACPRKRTREESSTAPKSKACREKMRRDKLNEKFVELSNILDPNRPPKADKAGLLSDASRLLIQLKLETQELKDSNEKLQEAIKDLKGEKNEMRDEKQRLKADKEMLEQQMKAIMATPAATGFMPHPMAFHPPPFTIPNGQANPVSKPATRFGAGPYPAMAMWHWLPPAVMDTTHDAKLFPPSA